MIAEAVSIENVWKLYGNFEAVRGISISVRKGEVFGLLGPNGAGKTTTISMLAGLLAPSRGSAAVCGHDTVRELKQAKQCIGLVPQEIALYPTLSAWDNLLYFGGIYRLRGRRLRKEIQRVLETVSLLDRKDEQVSKLSGGMKRRLNIAAGLLHNPDVLFLDEPTVGVDPQSRNAIFEHIDNLRNTGMTIIYTTHYMEEAQRLCDRVAIVDEGRIIAVDTPGKLIADLGGGAISLETAGKLDEGFITEIRKLQGLRSLQCADKSMEIEARNSQELMIPLFHLFNQTNREITSLRILEPNLETVFLNLTGKQLRE